MDKHGNQQYRTMFSSTRASRSENILIKSFGFCHGNQNMDNWRTGTVFMTWRPDSSENPARWSFDGPLTSMIYLSTMVMFHSYASLPAGTLQIPLYVYIHIYIYIHYSPTVTALDSYNWLITSCKFIYISYELIPWPHPRNQPGNLSSEVFLPFIGNQWVVTQLQRMHLCH